jgi:NADH-quinone oxidoreductase subunit F
MLVSGAPLISRRFGGAGPASFEEYETDGGYRAIRKLLDGELGADEAISLIEASGLRGRGGAGFPTGAKWRRVAQAADSVRYVIANADEGDPGAFMDRSLMESDPHAIIEGMMIAGFCLKARRGYLFTRFEYDAAAKAFEQACEEARERGMLAGGFGFDVSVVRSGGSYLCGESTALIDALENRLGVPRKKPPHTYELGLWGRPTCINNVETLANIAPIVADGPAAFRQNGTYSSPGTKLFCVTGGKERSGIAEVPLGMPMHELLRGFAPDGLDGYKAVQIGGPSGVIFPIGMNLALDYDALKAANGIMGSGGVVMLAKSDCIVETVRYFIGFSRAQSCGRCRACKRGLQECLDILDDMVCGKGTQGGLDRLAELCDAVPAGSVCGLGKSATRVLRSALEHFREEFVAHTRGECPALVCKGLIRFDVVPEMCPGCRCCLPTCPTNAMRGRFGKPFTIDLRLCARCRMCLATCPYYAVSVSTGNQPQAPTPSA